jgi:hypothetical protein
MELHGDVVEALGKIKDPRIVTVLIAALKDSDSEVRYKAVLALSKINDIRIIEPLITTLKDKDQNVRQYSAEALGKMKSVRARKALQNNMHDTYVAAGAYKYFINAGSSDSESALVAAIYKDGTLPMAEDYLNCGNPILESAARDWVCVYYENKVIRVRGGYRGPVWGDRKRSNLKSHLTIKRRVR